MRASSTSLADTLVHLEFREGHMSLSLHSAPHQRWVVNLFVQDSDRFWHVPPPSADALEHVLGQEEVVAAFTWSVLRSNPALSSHGGPLCHGTTNVTLSPQSRSEVLDILQVSDSASL